MSLCTSHLNLQLYSRLLNTYGRLLKKINETPAKDASNLIDHQIIQLDCWVLIGDWLKVCLPHTDNHCTNLTLQGSQVGAMVIILASHHWDPGLILDSYVGCDWLISIGLSGIFSGFSSLRLSAKINFQAKTCVIKISVLITSLRLRRVGKYHS